MRKGFAVLASVATLVGLVLVGLSFSTANATPLPAAQKAAAGQASCPVANRDYLGWCTYNLTAAEVAAVGPLTANTSVQVTPGDPAFGARAYSSNNVKILDGDSIQVRPRDQWAKPYGGTVPNGSTRVWPSDVTLSYFYLITNP